MIEPHATGHHAAYLRWVVEGIAEQGWRVVVATTPAALEHPLLADLRQGRGGVELLFASFPSPGAGAPGGLAIVRNELAHWWALRRLVRAESQRGDVAGVVLPYLDYCFFACGVLGVPDSRVPWHVISMRLSAVDTSAASGIPWKWHLLRRLLSARSLRTLFSICPSVRTLPAGWLTNEMAERLRYLPDPAEHRGVADRDAARGALGIPSGRPAVLVFGSIDERKGLDRLVEALVADSALAQYVLVIAGKQSESLKRALAAPLAALKHRHSVIEMDHVLDDEEQVRVFAAADVVWLGYDRHTFMSGVLVLAGRARLPVVATDIGEVGAFVREHGMGVLIERQGVDGVCGALRLLIDESARRRFGERAAIAVASHTPENFKQLLAEALAAADE